MTTRISIRRFSTVFTPPSTGFKVALDFGGEPPKLTVRMSYARSYSDERIVELEDPDQSTFGNFEVNQVEGNGDEEEPSLDESGKGKPKRKRKPVEENETN